MGGEECENMEKGGLGDEGGCLSVYLLGFFSVVVVIDDFRLNVLVLFEEVIYEIVCYG